MNKKNVLSLFSGCGGMDLGFEGGFYVFNESINTKIHNDWINEEKDQRVKLRETSFDNIFANDIEPHSRTAWVEFFSKRGKNPDIFHLESIVDLVKKAKNGNFDFPKNVDIVTGGFPCQDFSVAGKRKGFNSHKSHTGKFLSDYDEPNIENRGQLYMWMKEVIEITKPKIFIAENVKGLVNLSNVKEIIANDFRNINNDGYLVIPPQVLNAAEYGVPQNRERVFFIGFLKSALKKNARKALEAIEIPNQYSPYPEPTHYTKSLDSDLISLPGFDRVGNKVKHVTSGDVLKDLSEPEDEKHDLAQMSFSKARFYGKHVQGQTEIKINGVAPTIRAEHHGNIEFRRLSKAHGGKITKELEKGLKERRLTVRECARIQTFPDDFKFVIPADKNRFKLNLSPSAAYKLIGNAVPPLLAYHLARRIEGNWRSYFR